MRMTVIGIGYLGAVHAACMAHLGHEVLGVDTDAERIVTLAGGKAPFFEPGLGQLVSSGVRSGRLRFSTSLAEAAEFGDVHFICVGTPQRATGYGADISAVESVVTQLGQAVRRPCLIIGKSTVPVGTAAGLAEKLVHLSPGAAEVAWNPEFLREGLAVQDTLSPDRIVAGVATPRADMIIRELYAPLIAAGTPYIVTDLATAELVKVSANAFLATKISFINAIADICDQTGADVLTLTRAIGHDPRIGPRGMSAGLGFGGGCLPKDLRALIAQAEELGMAESFELLRAVDGFNTRRRDRAVAVAEDLMGGSLADRVIAVLGAAFKPLTDDVRDSPALAVAARLREVGAKVRVHDPAAIGNARSITPQLDYFEDLEAACTGAQLIMHLTEWPLYREIDPAELARTVGQPYLIDTRNALDLAKWIAAGWTVRGLGVHGKPTASNVRQLTRTHNGRTKSENVGNRRRRIHRLTPA
jgi:UDPglucose 6-dehydrogenase